MEQAVQQGDFGSGPRTLVRREAAPKGDHFAASVDFFDVSCGDRVFHVVAKVQPADQFTRTMMHTDVQFATEVTMYKEVLPLLGVQNMFPKIYFGRATGSPEVDVVLLEDMTYRGYRVTEQRPFLDLDHCRLALEALGRMHAASFVAKARRPDAFRELAAKLSVLPFGDGSDRSIVHCLRRGMEPLLERHGPLVAPAMEAICRPDFLPLVTDPDEPWAVVCHGDFCRNNMLFRYEDGRPVSCALFDLQTSRYSSPAIDISFFLYLNTDPALRSKYWDTLLSFYLSSLKTYLPSEIKLDFQGFFKDFAKRAIYGYFHCSFFLPMMIIENPPSVEDLKEEEQRIEVLSSVGGQQGTELIVSIVQHLIDNKYLEQFLEFIKKK